MAREQRKDVDYFPHDCVHGRKMHIIESKFGNDGYSTWFKLLEQLGKANNHFIDISDETNLMYLSSIFKISEEKTLEILVDLAKLGSIDKRLFDNYQVIWSDKFVKSIEDAYRKRKSIMFQYSDLLNQYEAKNVQSGAETHQSSAGLPEVIHKEKKRKEKESKEDIKLHCEVEKTSLPNPIIIPEGNIPKKTIKKTPAEKLEMEFWKELVAVWFVFYESKFNAKPTFNPAHAKSLKLIITNIKKIVVDSGEDWTNERSSRALNKFLTKSFEDPWIQQNFLLTNLNSKFDSIINKTKQENGKQIANPNAKQPYKFSVERIEAAANGDS